MIFDYLVEWDWQSPLNVLLVIVVAAAAAALLMIIWLNQPILSLFFYCVVIVVVVVIAGVSDFGVLAFGVSLICTRASGHRLC